MSGDVQRKHPLHYRGLVTAQTIRTRATGYSYWRKATFGSLS